MAAMKNGFTIWELLAIILLIVFMSLLLIPVVAAARLKGQMNGALHNGKFIFMATTPDYMAYYYDPRLPQ
jgi:competence protein ComGC